MTKVPRRITGRVTGVREGKFYVVVCPDAPSHLQRLLLGRWQMMDAEAGDTVVLEYQITSRWSLWNVIEVKR